MQFTFGFSIILVLLFGLQPVHATQAKDGIFNCATASAGSSQQKRKAASELLNHTYDTSKLACGAHIMTGFADANASDYDVLLSALQANALYVYYLDRIVLYDLGYLISWYVTEVPEETKQNAAMIALIAARKEQMRILQQARNAGLDSTEMDYYEALVIGPHANSLPLLIGTVAEDPRGLNGAAHALLAETYYTLPDIVGGDLELAISMMRAARERAPDNPRYTRLLAGYLVDIEQPDEVRSNLQELLSMQSGMSGWQLQADQLRAAAGLAERIGDTGLAEQLSKQRSAMLEAHPFLQNRKVVSAMGHFGDKDPMAEPDSP
jgi:hypothetical protein